MQLAAIAFSLSPSLLVLHSSMSDQFNDCWFLTGATATGKTGVALAWRGGWGRRSSRSIR